MLHHHIEDFIYATPRNQYFLKKFDDHLHALQIQKKIFLVKSSSKTYFTTERFPVALRQVNDSLLAYYRSLAGPHAGLQKLVLNLDFNAPVPPVISKIFHFDSHHGDSAIIVLLIKYTKSPYWIFNSLSLFETIYIEINTYQIKNLTS